MGILQLPLCHSWRDSTYNQTYGGHGQVLLTATYIAMRLTPKIEVFTPQHTSRQQVCGVVKEEAPKRPIVFTWQGNMWRATY